MTEKRSNCPIVFVVDLIGDRWTLLVIRDIFAGKCSFGEMAASAERIPPTTLTNRLGRLVQAGIVVKKRVPGGPGRQYHYELTLRGKGLLPVISEMSAWKAKHFPSENQSAAIS